MPINMAGEWSERLKHLNNPQSTRKQDDFAAIPEDNSEELDDLTASFLATMDEINGQIDDIKESNGMLFTALQNMLLEVMAKNTEALVQANNQFMHLMMRKLDELEDRISSDEPTFTNVLYSNPELFNEISERSDEISMEEEFASKNKVAELVDEEPQIPEHIVRAYEQFSAKEIKWMEFVKTCGGMKEAGRIKRILSSSS